MKINKWLKYLGIFFLILIIIYFLGPRPTAPVFDATLPKMENDLVKLDTFVRKKERTIPYLRYDNQARIIFRNKFKPEKTKYVVLYLHGFSASYIEGSPIHKDIAGRYGANIYFGRLAGHGSDEDEPFKNLTAQQLWDSAKESYAIAQQLGDSVVVMGSSTGASLGLKLATQNPRICAVVCYAPLVDFYEPALWVLDKPWGFRIASIIMGGSFFENKKASEMAKKYWTTRYHLNGAIALKSLVVNMMTPETFAQVKQPVFVGYYYKSESEQDKIASVKATQQMVKQLGSRAKKEIEYPNAKNHLIACEYTSSQWQEVRQHTADFLEKYTGMKRPEPPKVKEEKKEEKGEKKEEKKVN